MAPVHEAARSSDVEKLRRLLDEDPELLELEMTTWWRERPLHVASYAGSMEAVGLLLDRGAEIDGRHDMKETPLMRACEAGRVDVVSVLLDRGADPRLRDRDSWTALMYASYAGDRDGPEHVAVIRRLLEDGRVPVDARSHAGCTALWWACSRGFAERVRVLLLEGFADHTIAHVQGDTPLALAQARQARGQACAQVLEWFEGELEKAAVLSKARAVVDATESISKAPEKVGAKTEAEAQRAREEAAPAYLRGRVERGEALPSVEVVAGQGRRRGRDDDGQEEQWAVLKFVVLMLKEDLLVELMEGLRLR